MITFKKVRWRNFLSYGDSFTEIDLLKSPSTLIVGTNGAGKSSMLDALSFGLFGKAHRNINKDQLINSINRKGTVVEIEFEINKNQFLVRRGIKPTKFEIYKNNSLINQDSNSRDYQKLLEQNILKLNHKSFHQIVVLGSSSFIPFMALPSGARRDVIEDLLDINIFSKMNVLLKERIVNIRDELKDLEHIIDITNTKIDGAHKYIKDLKGINKEQIELKEDSIETHNTVIGNHQSSNAILSKELDENFNTVSDSVNDVKDYIEQQGRQKSNQTREVKTLVKEAKFYEDNDHCPTCESDLSQTFRDTRLTEIKSQASALSKNMNVTSSSITEAKSDLEDLETRLTELKDIQTKINQNNHSIEMVRAEISKLEKEIDTLNGSCDSGDLAKAQSDLEELKGDREKLVEKKHKLNDENLYNAVIAEMLKDSGIKTKVIKQYLPVMNKFINKYLQVLDFFVAFHLDESFNETIKSRHRDVFNYTSFSEGEKQRIDLALLFSWRQIAKMKNSASTNLLVLDETFDSSLDTDGIENLTKILETLDEGTNVFIISHKGDVLENKFRNKIEFYKERNFSKIK